MKFPIDPPLGFWWRLEERGEWGNPILTLMKETPWFRDSLPVAWTTVEDGALRYRCHDLIKHMQYLENLKGMGIGR